MDAKNADKCTALITSSPFRNWNIKGIRNITTISNTENIPPANESRVDQKLIMPSPPPKSGGG